MNRTFRNLLITAPNWKPSQTPNAWKICKKIWIYWKPTQAVLTEHDLPRAPFWSSSDAAIVTLFVVDDEFESVYGICRKLRNESIPQVQLAINARDGANVHHTLTISRFQSLQIYRLSNYLWADSIEMRWPTHHPYAPAFPSQSC